MPLYWFLLVITSLACDSVPGRSVPLAQSVLASLCLLSGWALLTRLAARSATRQVLSDQVAVGPASTALGHQMEVLRWLGLAMSLLALIGFGLAGLIDRLPWGGQWITVRALLLLLPAVAATGWSWWCELHFDIAAHAYQPPRRRLAYLMDMFRLQAAWLILPILVLLGVLDLTQGLLGVGAAHGATVGGILALVVLPLLLPTILGRIWSLRPIPDTTTALWCESLVAATGVRGLQLRQWDTAGCFCTALVAGFVPHFRRLLLSDSLLWRLSREQTAMVVLHELAHIRRWHLPLRLLVLLPVWGAASLVSHALGEFPWAEVAGIAAGLAASLLALRGVAYRTEFDADATACRMATAIGGRVEGVPDTFPAAAAALADALDRVTADSPESRRATWLHPSIDSRRAALLQRARSQDDRRPLASPAGGTPPRSAVSPPCSH